MIPANNRANQELEQWRRFEASFDRLYPETQYLITGIAIMKAFPKLLIVLAIALAGLLGAGIYLDSQGNSIGATLIFIAGGLVGALAVIAAAGGLFRRK